jgi:hypothetical protein
MDKDYFEYKVFKGNYCTYNRYINANPKVALVSIEGIALITRKIGCSSF